MERKMAHDFPSLSKVGRRSPQNGLHLAQSKVFGGIEKKAKACGPSRAGEVKQHKKLLDGRRALRPLLNAIRFVESSNRAHCPDGDNGASIGPLQISDEYHMDAWKHNKSFAWSRCRDLEHAENTVIAYWSRYCMDAVEKNDWETLAKTHNGGPQGPGREKTVYYWSKVSRHLQQFESSESTDLARNTALRSPRRLLDVYSKADIVTTSRTLDKKRGFTMVARSIKAALPAMTNKSSRTVTPYRRSKVRKSFKGRLLRAGASPQTPSRAAGNKQLLLPILRMSQKRLVRRLSDERRSDRISVQSALHFGYWSFPWSAKREEAAIVLQARWRMRMARLRYQSLQKVTLAIQRRWREIRRLEVVADSTTGSTKEEADVLDILDENGEACGGSILSVDLVTDLTAAEPPHKKKAEEARREVLKVPEHPVLSLYDVNISARQEDEILTELASFFPSLEEESDLTITSSRGNNEQQLSHAVFVQRKGVVSAVSFDSPQSDMERFQSPSPYSMTTWSHDICNVDSPAASPGKELTFANLSNDRSLPPTPIKEWSSRKRESAKAPPVVPLAWSPSDMDMVELPPSPTKDWASPTTIHSKSSFSPKIPPHTEARREARREEFCLPKEWFADLDRLEFPQSWWDTTQVRSDSYPSPVQRGEEEFPYPPLCPFTEVPDTSYGPEFPPAKDCDHIDSPSHQTKVWTAAIDTGSLQNTPVSIKHIAYTSPKTIDLSLWKDSTLSVEDVDSFSLTTPAKTPAATYHAPLESPLSPAMEEELLDELTKLFQGEPYPALASSETSNSPADSLSGSLRDSQGRGSGRSLQGKTQSRHFGQTLESDGVLESSARKLDFSLQNGDVELQLSAGYKEQSCTEGRNELLLEKSPEVLQDYVKGAKTQLMLQHHTSPQPSAAVLQAAFERFDELKNLEKDAESDDSKVYKRTQRGGCQSGDDLESVSPTTVNGISDGYFTILEESLERSPRRTPNKQRGQETHRASFEDEVEFCDKAVEGDVVAVRDSKRLPKDVANDSWQVQLDQELPNPVSKRSIVDLSFDQYRTRLDSRPDTNSCTPDAEQLYPAAERKSGGPGAESQQSSTRRQISFDHLDFKVDQRLCSSKDDTILLAGSIDTESLPAIGRIGPGSPAHQRLDIVPTDEYSAVLSKQERSSSMSLSRKYFLQSPSMKLFTRGCDSDSESVASTASRYPATADFLFETLEKKGSTEYGRALFACEDSSIPKLDEHGFADSPSSTQWGEPWVDDNFETMLRHRDVRRLWSPENLSGPLLMTSGRESMSSLRRANSSAWNGGMTMSSEQPAPTLQDLCKLWDEECVDLLTRSLKYKRLMTDPNLLSHEVRLAYEEPQPSGPQTIAFEIQNVERLLEKLENREALKELVKQQRDTIYINIATNATMRERYQLYSKWGIRRMSRGRLRKVIYELLWKDTKRYYASADLVLQYL